MLNKKGELTTQQIVILIILIMSFAVLLFFLFRLELGKTTDKEVCHNSVVTRGNVAIPTDSINLNCKTNYVCITEDGTCEQMTSPEIKEVETSEEIYEVLAEEMADCWWMFGEGKIDYIGDKALPKNYCSICTQLAFDDSIQNIKDEEGNPVFENNEISKDELYEYLFETGMPGSQETYAEYLFGTKNINTLKTVISSHAENEEGTATFGTIELDKQYFVVMGITSKIGNTYKWVGAGLVVLAFATPVGWVGGAILIGSGAAVATFGDEAVGLLIEGDGVDNKFLAPTIIEANSDKFELLECKDVTTFA